jgi:hypothetical protein
MSKPQDTNEINLKYKAVTGDIDGMDNEESKRHLLSNPNEFSPSPLYNFDPSAHQSLNPHETKMDDIGAFNPPKLDDFDLELNIGDLNNPGQAVNEPPQEDPPAIVDEEELPKWSDLKDMKLESHDDDPIRTMGEIRDIIKIFSYYENKLVKERIPFSELPEIADFAHMQRHYALLKAGRFNWEVERESVAKLTKLTKQTVATFYHPMDIELLPKTLLQLIYPLDLLQSYVLFPNYFGGKEYNDALKLQTAMMEIFLWHHLKSDVRFNLKVSTDNIGLLDPFVRIKIRRANRNDAKINNKYFTEKFNLKKFAQKLLDLFFPSKTVRYITQDQEMHRWSLYLILTMLELGLYTFDEIQELVQVIFQKLENLLLLEEVCYKEFSTKLAKFPQTTLALKKYFFECKEIVAAICTQVIVLINDRAFVKSHKYFGDKSSANMDNAWKSAFFDNGTISSIIYRIVTKYILQEVREGGEQYFTRKNISYTNDLINLVAGSKSDVFSQSLKMPTSSMIQFYYSTPYHKDEESHFHEPSREDNYVEELHKRLVMHMDNLALCPDDKKAEKYLPNLYKDLDELTQFLSSKNLTEEERSRNQYICSIHALPKIMLSITIMVVYFGVDEFSVQRVCNILVDLLKDNILGQAIIFDDVGSLYLKSLQEESDQNLIVVVETFYRIFQNDTSILNSSHKVARMFLEMFKEQIRDIYTEFDYNFEFNQENVLKSREAYLEDFFEDTLVKKRQGSIAYFLSGFQGCRLASLILEKKDARFEECFHEIFMEDNLYELALGQMIEIVLDQDFLPKGFNKYRFKPQLVGANADSLNNIIKGIKTGIVTQDSLRGMIFEVAISIISMLNKCCRRVIMLDIYESRCQRLFERLLPESEYMLELENGPAYRATILELFTCLFVHPKNQLLLSDKSKLFEKPQFEIIDCTEQKTNVERPISSIIIEELNRLPKLDTFNSLYSNTPTAKRAIESYFFNGFLPLIFKYCRGLLTVYVKDEELENIHKKLKSVQSAIHESQQYLSKYGIEIGVDVAYANSVKNQSIQGSDFVKSEGLNKIANIFDNALFGEGAKRRAPDNQEKYFPKLYEVRQILLELTQRIEVSYRSNSSKDVLKKLIELDYMYARPNALDEKSGFDSAEPIAYRIVSLAEKELNYDLMSDIIAVSGLSSAEYSEYFNIANLYLERKKSSLANGNGLFTQFLEQNSKTADNLIGYGIMLVSYSFKRLLKSKIKSSEASDLIMSGYFENLFIIDFVDYLSQEINYSDALKEALFNGINSSEAGKTFFSLIFAAYSSIITFCYGKTFFDFDWKIFYERFTSTNALLKNMCENNCVKFKQLFSEFCPTIPNLLNSYISGFTPVFKILMIQLEKAHRAIARMNNTTDCRLSVADRAEVYFLVCRQMAVVDECVTGPFEPNQSSVTFYTIWVAIVKRLIDNIDSNLYDLKGQALSLISSFIELNAEKTELYGANMNFYMIYDLMYSLLKKLFIHCTIGKNPDKFAALVQKAQEEYQVRQEQKKLAESEESKLNVDKFSFYNAAVLGKGLTRGDTILTPRTDKAEEEEEEEPEPEADVHFPIDNSSIINKEMSDCVIVKDYNAIMKTFLSDKSFSDHKILEIVIKLYKLLLTFCDKIAGYKISLESVHSRLVDRYGDSVPFHIKDKLGKYKRKPASEFDEKLVFYMFLVKITSEIELKDPKTGNDTMVTFPLHPSTFFMTSVSRDNFFNEVDLEGINVGLLKSFPKFQVEMDDNLRFYRKSPKFYKLSSDESFRRIKIGLWVLGLILNLLLIIFYYRDTKESTINFDGKIAIIVTASVVASISFFSLIVWFLSRYRQKVEISKLSNEPPSEEDTISHKVRYWFKIHVYGSILTHAYPMVFLIHIVSSLLGILVNPFFLTIQVLTVIFISETTNYVVRAITTHFDQLALTFMLSVLAMYCYAVLTAEAFFPDLQSSQNPAAYNCVHLWECIMYTVNYGLRSGGGIADVTNPVVPSDNPEHYVGKFFYDLIFFMLINVISLNIIFGIIIDTFAAMRDENTTRAAAFASRCSVCGVPRSQIEQVGGNFGLHVAHHHNFWRYCFYMVYLFNKPSEDYTGFEGRVQHHIANNSVMWIPQSKSEEEKEQEKEEEEEKVRIEEYQKATNEKLDQILKALVKEKPLDDLNLDLPDLNLDLDLKLD